MKNFSLSANFRKKLIGADQIYPICPWCMNFILIKQLFVTNSNEIHMKYSCICNTYSNKGISIARYNQNLFYFTYFKKGNCICGKRTGYKFCCDCSILICQSCIKNHLKHVLTTIQINNPFNICHNKMIEYYCVDCKKGLCLECTKKEHLKHKCYSFQEYKQMLQAKSNIFTDVSSFVKEKLKIYNNISMQLELTNLVKLFIKVFNEHSLHHINILHSIINLQNIKIEKTKINYKTTYKDYFNNPINISLINPSIKGFQPIFIEYIICISNNRWCVLFTNSITMESYCHIYSKNFYNVESKLFISPCTVKIGVLKENYIYIVSYFDYAIWNVENQPFAETYYDFEVPTSEIKYCLVINDTQIFIASIYSLFKSKIDSKENLCLFTTNSDDCIQQLEQYDDEHIIILIDKQILFMNFKNNTKHSFKLKSGGCYKNAEFYSIYASKKDNLIFASLNEENHSFIFVYTVFPKKHIYKYRYDNFCGLDSILLKDEYYIGIGDSGLCIFDKHTFKLIQMYKIPKKHCLMGQILVLPNQNLVVSLSEGITKIYG